MASPSIPELIRETLAQIASFDEAQIKDLQEALAATPPGVYRKDVIPQVMQRIQLIPPDQSEQVIEALFGLSLGRFQADAPLVEFVEDVVDEVPQVEGQKRDVLRERLSVLLETDCLKVGAKAYELLFEHEHNFLNARILTDVRPLFGESPGVSLIGAMVIHTLNINYVQSNKQQSFYIALDERDVKKLIEVLERAKSKAASLRTVLTNAQLPYVGVE